MSGVSVIIPVYNAEKFLNQAIDSILSQNFEGNIEIIVVDDGSTDNSISIAQSYNSRVVVIKKDKICTTQGASSTRNRGIKCATQKYVSFLDADDYYLPGFISTLVRKLENNNDLSYAFCRLLKLDAKQNLSSWTRKEMTKLDIAYPFLFRSYGISTNTIIVKRDVFNKVGLFDEDIKNGEDGDMWMRIDELYKGTFIDIEGAVYRQDHSDSQLTKTNTASISNDAKKVFLKALNRNILKENKDNLRIILIFRIIFTMEQNINNKRNKILIYLKLLILYPSSFFKMFKLYAL